MLLWSPFGATPALAGVGLSAVPNYPPTVKVGQTGLAGNITITYANTDANFGNPNDVFDISLVPACSATPPSADCPLANQDPGVFNITSATGRAGTACAGINFTITLLDAASGKLGFTPGFVLASTAPNNQCVIDFLFNVVQAPTKDGNAARSGTQTSALAGASATDQVTQEQGGGVGSTTTSFPAITTVQTPTSGTRGITLLTDASTLVGTTVVGVNNTATGTVTFRLYDPDQPTCTGTPRHTATKTLVAGNAQADCPWTLGAGFACSDTTGFVPDKSGTWQWVVEYSGDATNVSVISGCGAEPVQITQPVITIVKTPDGTQYQPGATINFTMVVTNQGPGTALNVQFSPADALPDPNSSLNWSVTQQPAQGSCSVSGAAGSQVLNCSFGDMAQGQSLTVIVSTATSSSDPGDCGNPLTLNNLARVVADNADPAQDPGSQFCQTIPTTLTTVQQPATGTLGITALNDQVTLVSGNNPTGTITVNLFDPDQPGCTGTPVFTQQFNLVGAPTPVSFTTSGGPVANKVGTWQWTASYSGDGNNLPSTSPCGAEPVTITKPVIAIVKTPDGTQYTAGQTINFTMVVTNQGPGTALNVRFSPADALPDPNASLNWSVTTQPAQGSCSVSGAAGSQVLNCNFGNMAQGQSLTVVVSTATQTSDPGDCGNPLVLNNSATVVADNADPKTDPGSQSCQGIPLVFSTTQNPSQGTLGTILNDTAQLTGGFPPYGGTVTFSLFDPDQPGCVGTPRYQQTVPVSPTGTASTSPGFAADKVGVWQWTAQYSGDGNNPPATSGCGQEPVIIEGEQIPTLSGWGMLLFVMLLVGVGSLMLSRRRNVTAG